VDIFPGLGIVTTRDQETQVGVGLNALFSFLHQNSVSPYLLVGAVYRWSHASRRAEALDAAGQVITFEAELNEGQFDSVFGLGTGIRWGTRRLLLEARAYGGTVIYLPLTIGLTF
jgi:hypothetical protein